MDPIGQLMELCPESQLKFPVNLALDPVYQMQLDFSDQPPATVLINPNYMSKFFEQKARDRRNPNYDFNRRQANPYEAIGKMIFKNRAAIKLANLDGVYQVSGDYSLTKEHDTQLLTFVDIAGGPESWAQYLMFRHPWSRGYGITLTAQDGVDKTFQWDPSILNQNFKTFTQDGSGDLYTLAETFGAFVRQNEPDGVDLAVADGGIENPEAVSIESEVTRLLVSEALAALLSLKVGGNLVIKSFELATMASAGLIYLLAGCFEEFYIIKPVTSRPANSERYLVGKSFRSGRDSAIEILQQAYQQYHGYLTSLVTVPPEFQDQLRQINDQLIYQQGRAVLQGIKSGYQRRPVNLARFSSLVGLSMNPIYIAPYEQFDFTTVTDLNMHFPDQIINTVTYRT